MPMKMLFIVINILSADLGVDFQNFLPFLNLTCVVPLKLPVKEPDRQLVTLLVTQEWSGGGSLELSMCVE